MGVKRTQQVKSGTIKNVRDTAFSFQDIYVEKVKIKGIVFIFAEFFKSSLGVCTLPLSILPVSYSGLQTQM